jgi:hypothetical protein
VLVFVQGIPARDIPVVHGEEEWEEEWEEAEAVVGEQEVVEGGDTVTGIMLLVCLDGRGLECMVRDTRLRMLRLWLRWLR